VSRALNLPSDIAKAGVGLLTNALSSLGLNAPAFLTDALVQSLASKLGAQWYAMPVDMVADALKEHFDKEAKKEADKQATQEDTSRRDRSSLRDPSTVGGGGGSFGGFGGGGGRGRRGIITIDENPKAVRAGGRIKAYSAGGLGSLPREYAAGGKYLNGPGDGMSDDIKANIDGQQEARLADGEFVIPADVVSHLGNGSSNAGAKKLYQMMSRIREARTGRTRQAPEVNADKYLPV
jgi:hypothetical protein